MLDPVPLAGSGRQVAHGDRQAELVGEPLQFDLPQADTRAVAATAIRGDQKAAGIGIALTAHLRPPAADNRWRMADPSIIPQRYSPASQSGIPQTPSSHHNRFINRRTAPKVEIV